MATRKKGTLFSGDPSSQHKDRGCYIMNTLLLLMDHNISRGLIQNCTTQDSCSLFFSQKLLGIVTLAGLKYRLSDPYGNQSGYGPLNLENGSFLNSDNFNATDMRF